MSDSPITIRTRKFMSNRLLNRKQMILDVIHPGRANVSKADLKSQLAKKFNVQDESTIFVFGFRTAFGGGRSTGFALVYDGIEDALANEPVYRLIRQGLKEKKTGSRKSRKELKNRRKRVRGTKKLTIGA